MAGRCVDREASPSAADIEHPTTGFAGGAPLADSKLCADQLKFLLLGLLERARAAREDGAAVGHRGIQKQREELVADVVVVAHGAAVARDRVPLAAEAKLGGRDPGRYDDPARADNPKPEAQLLADRERRRLERVNHSQRAVEIVNLDHAGDVRPADPELARRAEHVRERPGGLEPECRAVWLGRGQVGPVPKAERERAARKRPLEFIAQRRGPGEGHPRQ